MYSQSSTFVGSTFAIGLLNVIVLFPIVTLYCASIPFASFPSIWSFSSSVNNFCDTKSSISWSNVCAVAVPVWLSIFLFCSHMSLASSTLAPLVSTFASCDCVKIPLFPVNVITLIPH